MLMAEGMRMMVSSVPYGPVGKALSNLHNYNFPHDGLVTPSEIAWLTSFQSCPSVQQVYGQGLDQT